MTKPDWNALAAAERAVRDRMDQLLTKDHGSNAWPRDDERAVAYHAANWRMAVFGELAGDANDLVSSPTKADNPAHP